MSIPILETCKKRKRRPKLFGLHTFASPESPINSNGPFRDNIRSFLQECAELEDYNVQGMPTWCTLLVHETKSFVVPLYTIEEHANQSQQPYCDHCRCNGWSNHFVSKRKYHMIIPVDSEWNMPLEEGAFDMHTHLLHGLIHCNGFGHLICINGMEGGSKYVYGREIMDLWDRICTNLRARKITVEDLSKKHSMDLRLLYGVAYGHPWFGRWRYKFYHGSYGVTHINYERALEILSDLELDDVVIEFSHDEQHRDVKQLIQFYRDKSEAHLTTVRDLFRFMLTIKTCTPLPKKPDMATNTTVVPCSLSLRTSTRTAFQKNFFVKDAPAKYKRFSTVVANMDSRWPARRLEYAADIIVEALKLKKTDKFSHGGMTRQDVRDAARMHIGDTGLLDYVLKSMNNVIVGSHVVRRAVNPTTRILEYTISELGNGFRISEAEQEPQFLERLPPAAQVPGVDVYADVVSLYRNLLLNNTDSELVELATQTVLDSKYFVKEWPVTDDHDQLFRVHCHVQPCMVDIEPELNKVVPPGELITLPLHATLLELKQAATNALRDTYCIMDKFVVTDIENLEDFEDDEALYGKVELNAEVVVRGIGIDINSKLKYQGGSDTWMVRCECGAGDDDGERMVACDICEVWQHTRCCGIEDSETLPPLFVCSGCYDSLSLQRHEPPLLFENTNDLLLEPPNKYGAEFLSENAMEWYQQV